MDKIELTRRTRTFALAVFKLADRLPRTNSINVISNQVLRASASVASNYRSVNRAKSRADFGNKLKILLEEIDECNFWLEFLFDLGSAKSLDQEIIPLVGESGELVAIFAAASKTTALNKHL
jgi:four helix bundle protein